MPKNTDIPVFELEKAWIYKVTVLADLIARRVSETVQQTSGLNLSQWRVIAAVADKPGRTSSEVVDVTPMDKGIVSRAVGTLVERKIIERQVSPEDGRRNPLHLTKDGWKTYQDITKALAVRHADGKELLLPDMEARFLNDLDGTISAYRTAAKQP